MTAAQRWIVRTTLLAVGLCFLSGPGTAADPKGPAVPDADYPKVVDFQIKVLQETLKSLKDGKEDAKKMQKKALCTTIMVAAFAQDNLSGADAGQRAAVRDAAVRIAEFVKKDKYEDAAKLTAELKTLKADPKAKTAKIKLFDAHIDLDELMSQFRLPKAGGQGTEKLLLNLAQDKKRIIPTTGLNDNLLIVAYQSALAGELCGDYVPTKDKKDWDKLSADMRNGAIEFAEQIKAKDGKVAFAALNKLNASCSGCHDKFKNK